MPELPDFISGAPVGRQRVGDDVTDGHRRERVIVAATGAFAKRGYVATTVEDLVIAGRVGTGSFYALFDGKQDCLLRCFERILERAREAIAAAAADREDWVEQTYFGLRALLGYLFESPPEGRVALIEAPGAGGPPTISYDRALDAAVAWLQGGRRHWAGAGELPERFERAAVSGLAFFLQQELRSRRPRPVEELFAAATSMLLEPIVGAAELRRLSAERAAA